MAVALVSPRPSHQHALLTGAVERESDHLVLRLLDQCPQPEPAVVKAAHALMLRLDLLSQPFSASRLLTAACQASSLPYALKVFDEIPRPNLYSWNILIRAHSSTDPDLALRLFFRLLSSSRDEDGGGFFYTPDKFTYPFAIKAVSGLSDRSRALALGRAIHGMVVKSPFHSDIFILNSLLHFYSCCDGHCHLSSHLFNKMPTRDVVSWNSMITAFVRNDLIDEAVQLFREMEDDGTVSPDHVTMVGVLSACGKKGDLGYGRQVHAYIERNGSIEQNLILNNALLDMYVKCGSLDDARDLFDVMPEKDTVSWTTMMVGYAQSGDFIAARRAFDSTPSKGIATWNALIASYEQGGRPREALDVFREALLLAADVKPDEVSLVAALSACAETGALETGCWIHAYARRNNFYLSNHLSTSLIDMYSKCGDPEKAVEVFSRAVEVHGGDVFVWSSMIGGLAMHGHGRAALDLFERMLEAGVRPNGVTFTNVFCACSHAGLVEEGQLYLRQMLPVFGVEPKVEHYASLVDILARAGRLEEAKNLIEAEMPMTPGATAWGALLGGCAVRGNVKIGEYAFKRLVELQPANDDAAAAAYVLMSNLYARAGRLGDVARLRKFMKETGLKKEPGRSSIEVAGSVHAFVAGDTSHPLSGLIHSKLDEVARTLKAAGHVPDRRQVLQHVEEEEGLKERALQVHSERLAIALGLLRTRHPTPIRVTKNLRVCEDCHSVAKMVSDVYGREIVLRDRYRFHHFKVGRCSCEDYW